MQPQLIYDIHAHRRCPGIHLVESTIWFVLVSMIATMDISKEVNEHGHAIEPEIKFENTVFRYVFVRPLDSSLLCALAIAFADRPKLRNPSKFQFALKARSGQHARLVHEAVDRET